MLQVNRSTQMRMSFILSWIVFHDGNLIQSSSFAVNCIQMAAVEISPCNLIWNSSTKFSSVTGQGRCELQCSRMLSVNFSIM